MLALGSFRGAHFGEATTHLNENRSGDRTCCMVSMVQLPELATLWTNKDSNFFYETDMSHTTSTIHTFFGSTLINKNKQYISIQKITMAVFYLNQFFFGGGSSNFPV